MKASFSLLQHRTDANFFVFLGCGCAWEAVRLICILFYSKKIIIDVPILPDLHRPSLGLPAALEIGPQQSQRTNAQVIHQNSHRIHVQKSIAMQAGSHQHWPLFELTRFLKNTQTHQRLVQSLHSHLYLQPAQNSAEGVC